MSEYERWLLKWAFGMTLFVCAFFIGCTSRPKDTPTPPPSVQDVRGDSERFFHKMEQEEKVQPSP